MRSASKKNQKGNAILELALTGSVVFPLVFAMTSFGYSFYVYNSLQTAVRAGARFAAVQSYPAVTAEVPAAFRDAVRNVVVYGRPDPVTSGPQIGLSKAIVPGLTPANVQVNVTMNGTVPASVTVKIVNFEINAIVKTVRFDQKPALEFPYNG